MQRRLVQNFTFILEWGQGTVIDNIGQKLARAELGQAQVRLGVIDEVEV